MNKTDFLVALRSKLGKLPGYEVEQSIAFYAEMIDDRMEDGMSEQDAVAALGPVQEIATHIITEMPPIPKAIAKADTGSRTLNIVLLAVFSPFWVPIALTLAITAFAIYLSIWLVILSLWLTIIALILCAPLGIAALIWCTFTGFPLSGLWIFGTGMTVAGIGLFAFLGMSEINKSLVQLTRSFSAWLKGLFTRKGAAPARMPSDTTFDAEGA